MTRRRTESLLKETREAFYQLLIVNQKALNTQHSIPGYWQQPVIIIDSNIRGMGDTDKPYTSSLSENNYHRSGNEEGAMGADTCTMVI